MGTIALGQSRGESTIKKHLGATTPFSILGVCKGIERGSGCLFIFSNSPDGMAFGAEGVNYLILVIDIGFVVHHHHHRKPGTQFTSEDKIGNLAGDPAVSRSHPDDYQMVSGFRPHKHASDRDALAFKEFSHLKAKGEGPEKLALIGWDPHIGDRHNGVVSKRNGIDPINRPGLSWRGPVACIFSKRGFFDLNARDHISFDDDSAWAGT